MYLNISLISDDTGKSWYIDGSYAFASGALYSFWPLILFNICDDGESESDYQAFSPPIVFSLGGAMDVYKISENILNNSSPFFFCRRIYFSKSITLDAYSSADGSYLILSFYGSIGCF